MRERAEEERKEKKAKAKERRDAFRTLCEEVGVGGRTSWSEFSRENGKDERFKAIDKSRDRESLFNEYQMEVRKKEKEEKEDKRKQIKKDFKALLRETEGIDRHSYWSDIEKIIGEDDRYLTVKSSGQREDWFTDYVLELKDGHRGGNDKKRAEKERSSRNRSKSRGRKRNRSRSGDRSQEKKKKEDKGRGRSRSRDQKKREKRDKEEGEMSGEGGKDGEIRSGSVRKGRESRGEITKEPSCLLCTNTVYTPSVLCLQHLRAPRCDPIKLKTGVTVQPTQFKSGPLKNVFDITTNTASSLHFSRLSNFKLPRCGHQRMHKLQKQSVKHNDSNMGM